MTQNFGNVVLFGETGAGKSSIVNMIAGEQLTQPARTSSSPNGCTFRHEIYNPIVHGRHVILVDTAGLNEGDGRYSTVTVNHAAAIAEFYKLITELDGKIDLLMFCMRGPRIKDSTHANWKVFHEIICKKKVPIVLVVTGLENEDNMDEWWIKNKGVFEEQGIKPNATACITATRGKLLKNGKGKFDEEFEESQAKVKDIIDTQLRHRRPADETPRVHEIIRKLLSFFRMGTQEADIQRIINECHMPGEEAKKFREELARG